MKRSQGDQVRSAFDLLVLEHHVQVRAFGRSLGVEPEWVDDIAQEAFLTAYRDWKTFDPRGFGKWLRGIAANSVRDELGKNARRQRILRSEPVELFIVSQLSPKIFGDDILDGVGFPELN